MIDIRSLPQTGRLFLFLLIPDQSDSLNQRFSEPEIRGKQPINSDKIQILTALI